MFYLTAGVMLAIAIAVGSGVFVLIGGLLGGAIGVLAFIGALVLQVVLFFYYF